MAAVEISGITKHFGKKGNQVEALCDVSFSVLEGSLFGLIGPDGAGKTTLFRILSTLLLADSGQATVIGFDVVKNYREIRKRVGYMPGKFSLYQDLTVEENLQFFATIFDVRVEDNYDLIRDIYVKLEPFRKRKAGALSGGMKQKLALSCALIHKPEILFLDEPTTGVDAVSRKEFWDILKGLQKQGITILVSTPYMDEASRCDRIALLQSGKLFAVDSPENILEQFEAPLFAVKGENMAELLLTIREFEGTEYAYPFGEYHHVVLKKKATSQQLENVLSERGYERVQLKEISPHIEDCFIAFMKT